MRSCCVACSGSIQAKPADRTHPSWVVPDPGFGGRLDEQRSRLAEKLTCIATNGTGCWRSCTTAASRATRTSCRPVKLTAKNALFAGHDEGTAGGHGARKRSICAVLHHQSTAVAAVAPSSTSLSARHKLPYVIRAGTGLRKIQSILTRRSDLILGPWRTRRSSSTPTRTSRNW